MRINSVNVDFCEQIKSINELLKKEIQDEYYCVLFLDNFYLKEFKDIFQKNHFVHEILFYGYDDTAESYKCYGYLGHSYQRFELSYEEVERGFAGALKHIRETLGWHEYMFLTMDIVAHDKEYPYRNDYFIEKLKQYMQGEIPYNMYYDNRFYMRETKDSRIAFGVNVIEAVSDYVDMLLGMGKDNSIYDQFVSQQAAFNMLWSFYKGMGKRLCYFAEKNGLEKTLEKYITDYYDNVVKRSELIRLLYLKLSVMVRQGRRVENVLNSMAENLLQIRQRERVILTGYLNEIHTSYPITSCSFSIYTK